MYGSSEVSIATVNYPDDAAKQKQGTAGVPLPGYSIRILDPQNKDVHKAGDIGEICVKNDAAVSGYHNRPDADMDSFVGEQQASSSILWTMLRGPKAGLTRWSALPGFLRFLRTTTVVSSGSMQQML